ncbi:MAG TPA: DUF6428 family protein [Aquaticitalea sp.]|nr:DUF6428 family protein [Aquaticitalea sp.]
MKTEQFLTLLSENQAKNLLFEYHSDRMIGANYHITEVKHVSIDSVDCGAQTDSWNETIIQLWESPSEVGKTDYMSAYKALGILRKVGKMKPFDLESEVKFEYGNATFHTAQLFVQNFEIEDNNMIIKLAIEKTDCKAKELCGIPKSNSKIRSEEPCCSADGNCC